MNIRKPIVSSPNRHLWQFSIIAAGVLFFTALAIAITFLIIHQQKIKDISTRSELISQVMTQKSLYLGTKQLEQLESSARAMMELEEFNSISLRSASGEKIFEFGKPVFPDQLSHSFTQETRWHEGGELLLSLKIDGIDEEPRWLIFSIDTTQAALLNLEFLFFSLLIVFGILAFSIMFYRKLNKEIFQPIEALNEILSKQNKMQDITPIVMREAGVLDELVQHTNESISIQIEKEVDLRNSMDAATQELRESLETVEIHNIDLDMARKNALELNKLKSEFLKKVSHDLRTPLGGILNYSELLSKTSLSTEQVDHVTTIEESTKGLLTIVNDIHDFSRLESGTLQVDNKPMNIRRTIEESLTLQSSSAAQRGVSLYSSVDQDVPNTLLGDSLRVQQVLSSLISNAIKFERGSYVEVCVNKLNQSGGVATIKINIISNGQCPIEFKDWQEDDEISSKDFYSGAGMGLSVAKGVAHHIKGRIEFENTEDYCKFVVVLNLEISESNIELSRVVDPSYQINALVYSNNDIAYREVTSRLYELGIHNQRANTFSEVLALAQKLKDETEKHARHLSLAVIEAQSSQQSFDKIVLTQTLKTLQEEFGIPTVVISPMGQFEQLQKILKDTDASVTQHPLITSRFRKEILDQLGLVKLVGDNSNPTKLSSKAIKILLVDDNAANLKLAKALLNDFNVNIQTADSGATAINHFEQTAFDLVFMDIQLPDIDGFETTKRLRRFEQQKREGKRTPIIALTAHNISDEKTALLLAGMDDVIGKPLTKKQLSQIIDRWVIHAKKKVKAVTYLTPNSVFPNKLEEPAHQVDISTDKQDSEKTSDAIPVNISECLNLAKNDPELAHDMLDMLIHSLDDEKANISSAQNAVDYAQMYDHVHRLHGASCYCGVPRLKEITKKLDSKLRNDEISEIDKDLVSLYLAIDEMKAWAEQHDLKAIFDIAG